MASIQRRLEDLDAVCFRDLNGKQHCRSSGTTERRIAEVRARQFETIARGLCTPQMMQRISCDMHSLIQGREEALKELALKDLLPIDGHERAALISPGNFRTMARDETTLDLSITRMPEMPPVPEGSGVYFLLQGHQVVYVGQSTQLSRRIIDHLKDKLFDGVACFPVRDRELPLIEAFYIALYKPLYNKEQWKAAKRRRGGDL